MDLREAEDMKNRRQEYTEELYKKDLHDPDDHDGVTTHLEPDILKCEVKWALESITMNKVSEGDGIPVELFQILKDDDAVKVLHSIYQQIWKMQQWPQDWKRSVFIPIPKKGNAKECSNSHTTSAYLMQFRSSCKGWRGRDKGRAPEVHTDAWSHGCHLISVSMVSVCLPSDALLQHLPSYLGFSTLDVGYLFTAAPAKRSQCSLPWTRGISSRRRP